MSTPSNPPGSRSTLRAFLASEAAGGLLLIAAAALAIMIANSPLGPAYGALLHLPMGPILSPKLGVMTPQLWINDGLMALFFLLVGLEIKRELVVGALATPDQRRLPCIAAAAGMIVPALTYLAITAGDPPLGRGWAIPAATDIAFALGVLTLLGKRVPASLKLLLTTIAIVDDMGAVFIIAIVYTAAIDLVALTAAAVILLAMYGLNRWGVRALPVYLTLAAALWYAVLLSGVHATVAGVLAAAMIPVTPASGGADAALSPLHRLEHMLMPIVGYCIVPLFGFANAGVSLAGVLGPASLAPLPLGIAAGLFFGKQVGIFATIWLCVQTGVADRPRDATWPQIYGIALLCGIGFTMSLFIGALAFPSQPGLVDEAKIGILLGSLGSAVAGYAMLRFTRASPGVGRGG